MVSFSTMLQTEPHIIIYSAGEKYEPKPIYVIFTPLDLNVWICCFGTLILVSACVKLLTVYEKDVLVNPVLVGK